MMKLGTLGSPLTFAGQATQSLTASGEHDEQVAYFDTMDAVADAVHAGLVDGGVLTSETSHTQATDTVARILEGDRLFVAEEVVVPYHCALLVKPGARVEDIRHVGGHGSLRQCGEYLATTLAHATAEMHRKNSVVAAQEILDSDGSIAVIATEAVAEHLGLEILERDVDHGSSGGWWVLTSTFTQPPASADHLAVVVEGQDGLDAVVRQLHERGLRIRTITNRPSGRIFEYRYFLTARTECGEPLTTDRYASLDADVRGVFTTTTTR